MAAPPVKSQPLHNFTFPQWARKSNPSPSAASHHRFRRRDSPDRHPEPDQQSADASPVNDVVPSAAVEDDNGEGKGWNLRPRKTAVKTASVPKKETGGNTENNNKTNGVLKSQRLQNGGAERNGKRKLWISLSKEEIEEDIYALTGGKPARRPRKWPRNVQKQLDNVFPGLYLVGVAADSYRVTMLWYVLDFSCLLCEFIGMFMRIVKFDLFWMVLGMKVWSCDLQMKLYTFRVTRVCDCVFACLMVMIAFECKGSRFLSRLYFQRFKQNMQLIV